MLDKNLGNKEDAKPILDSFPPKFFNPTVYVAEELNNIGSWTVYI